MACCQPPCRAFLPQGPRAGARLCHLVQHPADPDVRRRGPARGPEGRRAGRRHACTAVPTAAPSAVPPDPHPASYPPHPSCPSTRRSDLAVFRVVAVLLLGLFVALLLGSGPHGVADFLAMAHGGRGGAAQRALDAGEGGPGCSHVAPLRMLSSQPSAAAGCRHADRGGAAGPDADQHPLVRPAGSLPPPAVCASSLRPGMARAPAARLHVQHLQHAPRPAPPPAGMVQVHRPPLHPGGVRPRRICGAAAAARLPGSSLLRRLAVPCTGRLLRPHPAAGAPSRAPALQVLVVRAAGRGGAAHACAAPTPLPPANSAGSA